jgi:hypothetical protein
MPKFGPYSMNAVWPGHCDGGSQMRSSLASPTALLVALFAVAGCGGSVSGAERDAGPGDDSGVEPPGDAGPVNPACPAQGGVSEGAMCTVSGLVCPESAAVYDCQGNAESLACFCDGESWTCQQASTSGCPFQTCLPPYDIFPGDSCVALTGPQSMCPSSNVPFAGCSGVSQEPSTMTGMCDCTTSGWSCPTELPTCVVDPPPSCPSPSAISRFGFCSAIGMTCPANPQDCDGQTYFDTYECQNDPFGGDIVTEYWIPVATTACDVSGDAGVVYPSFDGAVVDAITRDTN